MVKENTFVTTNDAIGKVIPTKDKARDAKILNSSTFLRNNESGYIDKVYYNRNGEGHKFTIIRSERIPKMVINFQGGRRERGMTFRHQDMPYTKDGITPDIIINPHAIPSRMTIAQLIECIW